MPWLRAFGLSLQDILKWHELSRDLDAFSALWILRTCCVSIAQAVTPFPTHPTKLLISEAMSFCVMSEKATPEITIEPYKKIVIHEVIEYQFSDYVELVLTGTRAAGGTTIPLVHWCNGIVFQVVPFNPNGDAVIEQQLEGIVHYSSVSFALKEKFEPEVRSPLGTLRLINASANPNFVALADLLRRHSKYKP